MLSIQPSPALNRTGNLSPRPSSWKIGRDNFVKGNPYEFRRLRGRHHLTDRTLHIECPNYPEMDVRSARAIAVMALSDAAIGKCGKILVKGPRWKYEFDTKTLNLGVQKKTFGGRLLSRTGTMHQNPIERVLAGSFYDETRQIWAVPRSYNVRERIVFK